VKNRWVVNASPLILLGKIGQLSLLTRLTDELIVPASVVREINLGPSSDPARKWLLGAGKRFVKADAPAETPLTLWDLGDGETAVLSWARGHSKFEALLDDRAARQCARAFGINYRGTLGVVLAAKAKKLIPAAKPLCDALIKAGYHINPATLRAALRLVGE